MNYNSIWNAINTAFILVLTLVVLINCSLPSKTIKKVEELEEQIDKLYQETPDTVIININNFISK